MVKGKQLGGRHDDRLKDIHHNDTQQNVTQHKDLLKTFSIDNTQHNETRHNSVRSIKCRCAECRYADCRGAVGLAIHNIYYKKLLNITKI